MTEWVTVTSPCYMDFKYYPFDTQECHLLLVIKQFTKKDVVFSRFAVEFASQRILLEYEVSGGILSTEFATYRQIYI